MPGIVGVVDSATLPCALRDLVRAMAARLAVHHQLRVEIDPRPSGPAVLGRVDLGILDPTPAPAVSADGACRLVLAGEVAGVGGGAHGLLATYLAGGAAALRGLSGSFAAALWDGRAGRLHLVNDRFGLRNVYYAADRTRLVFAPQLWALLAHPDVPRVLDPQAVAEFLTFQCVLLDRTMVDGVRLLPPATLLTFEPGRRLVLESTWSLRYRARPGSPREHAEELAGALRRVVAHQANGGPRVGLPLSGGLDSRTLLAAVPREHRALPTITYGRAGCDDLELAARLARLAGMRHHTIALPPGYIAAEAETMVARTDGMHLCLNAHAALLRRASETCDVLLLGNGGDCLLDGLWEGEERVTEKAFVNRLLGRLQIGLPPGVADVLVAPTAPFARVRQRAVAGLETALADGRGDRPADRADRFNVVHRHRRWVLQGVPAQATHVDFRHPYYADAVVEVALGVPAALRHHRRAHVDALCVLSPELASVRRQGLPYGFTAPPWRERAHALGGRVRDAVRWRANRLGLNPLVARPRRGGFADYDDELRHGSRALLEEVLLSPRTLHRGWWHPERLSQLVQSHLDGRANHAVELGVVLTVELFVRDFLEAA